MTTPHEIYLPNATYDRLKAKLAQLIAQPDTEIAPGLDPDSAVVTALGEIGNIWPESVLTDIHRSI